MPTIGVVEAVHQKGPVVDIEWKIENFFHFSNREGICYKSPLFSFNDQFWDIGIYDSYSSDDAFRCLNLYLSRRTSGPPIMQVCSVAFKTMNGQKHQETHCAKVFKGWPDGGHGFPCFISMVELSRRHSELIPSGVLTVVCTMQKSMSARVANNLNKEDVSEKIAAESATKNRGKRKTEVSNISGNLAAPKVLKSGKNISLPEKESMNKPIKCSECSCVIPLQDCQIGRGTNVSGSPTLPQKNKILEDLKQLFLKQENCDVVLKVKGQEFNAHKIILAARSPVLASTFQNAMKKETVDIEDCDPSSFSHFLCFLYSEDVENLSRENAFDLFTTAHKYNVPDLRQKCMEFIKENLCVDTFCETISLALQHGEIELFNIATDFFIKHAEKILITVKWQAFVAENQSQSNELFSKFIASVKHDPLY